MGGSSWGGGDDSLCRNVCVSVFVCVQIGVSPCKQLEVYKEKAVKMKDTPPPSSSPTSSCKFAHMQTHTHTLFLFSGSMSLCLSHVLVQIYCPLCDQLPGPSVSQRWGRSTVKPSHITVPLLITGGPRQVAAMLATRINARI